MIKGLHIHKLLYTCECWNVLLLLKFEGKIHWMSVNSSSVTYPRISQSHKGSLGVNTKYFLIFFFNKHILASKKNIEDCTHNNTYYISLYPSTIVWARVRSGQRCWGRDRRHLGRLGSRAPARCCSLQESIPPGYLPPRLHHETPQIHLIRHYLQQENNNTSYFCKFKFGNRHKLPRSLT